MMNISCRLFSLLLAFAFLGLATSCSDSGHLLGNSRIADAGNTDGTVPTGGTTGTGGASNATQTGGSTGTGGATAIGGSTGTGGGTAIGGATGSGGATGGTGGRGGTSTATDAGAADGDTAVATCGFRGESCASRPCCGPLVCLTLSNPPSCYESYPPPVDSGSLTSDAGSSRDTSGTRDTSADASCPLPEGCGDAAGAPDASTACPSTAPASGSTCVGQTSCFYEVCPSPGRTQATCTAGKWVVETGACGQVSCQGNYATGPTCPSGQVCLAKIGGARLISCIANACGSGPASPDCTDFTAGCTPLFSLSSGITYYCNTCPAGQTCA